MSVAKAGNLLGAQLNTLIKRIAVFAHTIVNTIPYALSVNIKQTNVRYGYLNSLFQQQKGMGAENYSVRSMNNMHNLGPLLQEWQLSVLYMSLMVHFHNNCP